MCGSNEKFTLIVTHFKSKSCTGASGANLDQADGQGCFNSARKLQAQALLSFISGLQSATGDLDIVAVGDYNAYEEEDPMDILKAGGLSNILTGTYSYVFDGQSGSLDHALVTSSLISKVGGASKWHINADEPLVKSYDQQFNPPYAYNSDAFRSSDHDPVLLGLQLGNNPPVVTIISPSNNSIYNAGTPINLTADAFDAEGIVKVEFYNNGVKFLEDSIAPYGLTSSEAPPGNYVLTAIAFDPAGNAGVSDIVRISVTACTPAGNILGEGYTGIPGTQVVDLTSNPAYPNNPSVTAQLAGLEYSNVGDDYGGRLRGYICAPQTGDYTFYIAGDDQAGLFLSTDENPANKILVAYNIFPVGFRDWTATPTQKSVPIRLIQGARYYIETLHKQSGGLNHLSVAWVLPDGNAEGPIPGNRLSPIGSGFIANSNISTIKRFDAAMQQAINNAALKVTVAPNSSSSYFTLVIQSNSNKALNIVVTDAAGRVVETKRNVASNQMVQIGDKLIAGVYFVELMQDGKKQRVKLVKH